MLCSPTAKSFKYQHLWVQQGRATFNKKQQMANTYNNSIAWDRRWTCRTRKLDKQTFFLIARFCARKPRPGKTSKHHENLKTSAVNTSIFGCGIEEQGLQNCKRDAKTYTLAKISRKTEQNAVKLHFWQHEGWKMTGLDVPPGAHYYYYYCSAAATTTATTTTTNY